MNDGCPVTTTYYGGVPLCSIANDKDPAPCQSESCDVCDALRNSFGNLPYGPSSGHGAYVNLHRRLSLALAKLILGFMIATGRVYTRIEIQRWHILPRLQVMINGRKTLTTSSSNAA